MWLHYIIAVSICMLVSGHQNAMPHSKKGASSAVSDTKQIFIIHVPDSYADESSVETSSWRGVQVPLTNNKLPSNSDIEIFRSIELDFDYDSNFSEDNITGGESTQNHLKALPLQENKIKVVHPPFKASAGIHFSSADAFIPTAPPEEVHTPPCKELIQRSAVDDSEFSNNFNLHSRVLLGRVLLRKDDATESKFNNEPTKDRSNLNQPSLNINSPNYSIKRPLNRTRISQFSSKSKQRNLANQTQIQYQYNSEAETQNLQNSNIKISENPSFQNVWANKYQNGHDLYSKLLIKRKRKGKPLVTHWDFGRKTSNFTQRGVTKQQTKFLNNTPGLQKTAEHYIYSHTRNMPELDDPQEQIQQYISESNEQPPLSSLNTLLHHREILRSNKENKQVPWSIQQMQRQQYPTQVILIQPYSSDQQPQQVATPVLNAPHNWHPVYLQEAYVAPYPVLFPAPIHSIVPVTFRQPNNNVGLTGTYLHEGKQKGSVTIIGPTQQR